jgi:hypothetical protein
MKPLTLTNVSGKYGAPMGRRKNLPENKDAKGKLQMRRLHLYDGAYDEGGAYWGMGRPLYHAEGELDGEDEITVLFLRADSRQDAKDFIRETLPNVTFFH